jgi:hypothetical protein
MEEVNLHYRVLPGCVVVWRSNPDRWPDTLEVCLAPDSMTVWVEGAGREKLWVKVGREGVTVQWL